MWRLGFARLPCAATQWSSALASVIAALAAAPLGHAHAQQRVVVAFPTHTSEGTGHAEVDRALRSALGAREDVTLAPVPALDLEATQLAIECVGTTARCLRVVAERTSGEILLAPAIEQRGRSTELRILYFAESDGKSRFAARREARAKLTSETLDAIPAMLDELFASSPERESEPASAAELPAPETTPATEEETASEPRDQGPELVTSKKVPVAPLIVAGGGVVLVGAGLVTGAIMRSTQKDYERQPVTTIDEAEKADELRARGKQQAMVANVLLIAGGAAVAAGGVWLVIALTGEREPQTAVAPELGPDHAGLRVWGAL